VLNLFQGRGSLFPLSRGDTGFFVRKVEVLSIAVLNA
jgi:hypothetical protein